MSSETAQKFLSARRFSTQSVNGTAIIFDKWCIFYFILR